MSRNKTNRQVLAKAVKDLTDIELVFMRERLLAACDDVLDNADQLRTENKNSIISPDLMIASCQKIKESIDF